MPSISSGAVLPGFPVGFPLLWRMGSNSGSLRILTPLLNAERICAHLINENGNEIILNVRTISSKLLSSVSEKRGFLSGVIDGSMSRQHVTAVCRQI